MEQQPESAIKPRALEEELSGAAGSKRRASVQTAQDGQTPGGAQTEPQQQNKRLRATSLGLMNRAYTPQVARLQTQHLPPAPATAPLPGALYAADTAAGDAEEKPDVFEYFAQRATRHRELEQEVERLRLKEASLNRKLQDSELQVSRLRNEVTGIAARNEAREAQIQLQRQQAEAATKREMERAAAFEVELRAAQKAQAQAHLYGEPTAAPAADFATSSAAASAADEARELRLKLSELEYALTAARAEGDERASRAAAELERERQLRAAETETATALRDQLAEAHDAADAAAAARRDAEARCATLEAAALSAQAQAPLGRSGEGDAVLIKSLREQLKVAQASAAAADALRRQAADAVVLRERTEAAEARARRAEQLLDSENETYTQLATAQADLQRWNAVLAGVRDCTTPEDVLGLVKRLQDREVAAAAGTGDLGEALAAARADLEAANSAEREAQAAAQVERARAEASAAALVRAERRVEMLARERDSLKAVLASYDEEYLAQNNGEQEVQPAQRRIAELEATVEALHSHVANLEAELGTGTTAQAGSVDAAAQAATRAEAAEARVRSLEAEAENLGRQVALLQERVGRGEYNPETTRVLHLRSNPEAELQRTTREARVAELESENQALRENIQRLEVSSTGGEAGGTGAAGGEPGSGGGGGGGNLGGGLRIAQLEGEANLLRRRLAEGQKSSDRLQQVFTRQITTFREAMLGLFGYKVEMTSDPGARELRGQFTLRPQYADEPGAEIAFRMMRDGKMVLVPTDYSTRRLAREVETFVTRFKSIPAFTANLTMETFQRHTQG